MVSMIKRLSKLNNDVKIFHKYRGRELVNVLDD